MMQQANRKIIYESMETIYKILDELEEVREEETPETNYTEAWANISDLSEGMHLLRKALAYLDDAAGV